MSKIDEKNTGILEIIDNNMTSSSDENQNQQSCYPDEFKDCYPKIQDCYPKQPKKITKTENGESGILDIIDNNNTLSSEEDQNQQSCYPDEFKDCYPKIQDCYPKQPKRTIKKEHEKSRIIDIIDNSGMTSLSDEGDNLTQQSCYPNEPPKDCYPKIAGSCYPKHGRKILKEINNDTEDKAPSPSKDNFTDVPK